MKKLKVAVVGVCVSRDPFNSRFAPEYKNWYEVVNTTFQMSIISLMSKSVDLSEEDLKDTCKKDAHRQNLRDEMCKKYIDELIQSSADYIVLDLYSEIRYGIIALKDTYLTNAQAKIRQTEFYKQNKYDKIIMYHKDKKEYMELFDRYFSEFINTIQENMPKAKIVLVKGRYAHSYIDDEHIIRYMDAQKFSYTDRENRHWKELNDYIEEKYNLESIDMTKREYFADPNYPFGFSPWHYEKQYYHDFIKELNSICLKDMLDKSVSDEDDICKEKEEKEEKVKKNSFLRFWKDKVSS